MVITHQKITSLAEVDFDYLFIESAPRIDGNFLWHNPRASVPEKRDFYYNQLSEAINGASHLRRDGEIFFMFKSLIDGQDKELSAGFIGDNGQYRLHWNLSAPDATGSRNWIYTQEARESRRALLNASGITSYVIPTYVGSDIYKFVKYRENAGNFRILEERPTVFGPNPNNLVTLVISI